MLDKKKSYGTVYGESNGAAYEQDGKSFNRAGLEIDHGGHPIEKMPEDVKPKEEAIEPERKEAAHTGLTFGDTDKMFLIDRVKIRFGGDKNFLKKVEIQEELTKMDIDHSGITGRDDLLGILKDALGV